MEYPFLDANFEVEETIGKSQEWHQGYRFYHEMKRRWFSIYRQYHEDSRVWWNDYNAFWEEHRRKNEVARNWALARQRTKEELIRSYRVAYGPTVMIETGTFLGDTCDALKSDFEEIFTVEIDRALCDKAKKLFRGTNVHAIYGNSTEVLPAMVAGAGDRQILFWLDAHWCGEGEAPVNRPSPIRSELEFIFTLPNRHVILVDDARFFGGPAERDAESEGYPDQGWVEAQAIEHGYAFAVEGDIMRLTPC